MNWLIGGFVAYYLLIAFGVFVGILRTRGPHNEEPSELSFVSVVMAAKDEEATIQACLESLLHQDYPSGRYEVIAINDRSSDRTGEIIDMLARQYPHLMAIHMSDEILPGLTGKQRALVHTYDKCRGEFVLNTDADCVAPASWLRGMVAHFHADTGMVLGIPVCHAKHERAKLFTKLQSLDMVHLLGYAIGAAAWNRTTTCIGNNMAYRRRAVDELGGLVALPDSVTEDAVLAQAMEYQTNWKVDAALAPDTVIRTHAAEDLRRFYRQRKRWLVGGMRAYRSEVFLLNLLYAFHVLLVALPFLALFGSPEWWTLGVIALALKLTADTVICYTMCRRVNRLDLLRYLLPYEFFLIAYSVVVGTGAFLTRRVVWKGQRYRG